MLPEDQNQIGEQTDKTTAPAVASGPELKPALREGESGEITAISASEQETSDAYKQISDDQLGIAIDPNNPFADVMESASEAEPTIEEALPMNALYLGVPPEEQAIMQQQPPASISEADETASISTPSPEQSPVAESGTENLEPVENPPQGESASKASVSAQAEIAATEPIETQAVESGASDAAVAEAPVPSRMIAVETTAPQKETVSPPPVPVEPTAPPMAVEAHQDRSETTETSHPIQSDTPIIDPRIKEIFAQGNTILSNVPDPNASDGFELSSVPGEEKGKQKPDQEKKKYSRFARILHITSALALGIFLLATTLLIGGSALEKQVIAHINSIEAFGQTKIEISSGDSYFIRGNYPIFGGETISVQNGSAIIRFEEGSIVRLRGNSEIKIHQIYPYPVISMEKGEMWVFGNRTINIAFTRSVFFARSNSARFQKEGDKVTASSYMHPLFAELSPPGSDRKAFFAIPSKRRIVFAENSIPRALPDLHFSKLKKEIHFSDAEQDSWANTNIVEDTRYVAGLAEDMKLNAKDRGLGKGIFANIQDTLVLFPDKKKRNLHASAKNRLDTFLSELIVDGKPFTVNAVELSDEGIDQAINTITLVEPNNHIITTSEDLYAEAKKRNLGGDPQRIIAQNSLSLFEDALNKNDAALAESILENMVKEWGTAKRSEENKIMLEMYREIIADLFRKNLNIITPAILHASTRLDTIAIGWGKKQMAVITTLEIIEKNLVTADTFLEKSKLEMAKNLLDINDVLLNMRPTNELNASYESLRNRQEYLREKYGIFKTQGWISKAELYELLRKREDAKRILSYMQEEERKLLEMNMVQPEKIPLADQIHEDFLQNKLLIVSMIGAEDEEAQVVEIVEAKLPDGQTFSGEYLPEFKVIRNVKLEGEEANNEIDNELKIGKLISTIEALRVSQINSIGEDLRELRTNPLPKLEEDPVAKMDPIVIEVTKRLAHATLIQKGFQVLLKDVLITSQTMLRIRNVGFEPTAKHTLEFDYNNETKQVSNIVLHPENVTVYADSLDTLSDQAMAALEEYQNRINLQEITEFALNNAGMTIAPRNIRYTPTGVHFQNAEYHDWIIAGLADAERRVYIDITKGGKSFLKNVPFDSLGGILRSKWEAEESIKSLDIESAPATP